MKIIFLGPPGAGKGTYASRLSPILKVPQISTGDIFRAEVASGSVLGKKLDAIMKKGELVPDELTVKTLMARIGKPDCRNGFILDGFPRTINQAEMLDKKTKIDHVLNILLDRDILIRKMEARRVCKSCGKIYNVADIKVGSLHMPPLLPKKKGVCDDCKGPLIQRKDDTKEIIEDRMKEYERKTAPLIEYYRKRGMLKDVKVVGGPEIMIKNILKLIGK
jgi:adenylate kinase